MPAAGRNMSFKHIQKSYPLFLFTLSYLKTCFILLNWCLCGFLKFIPKEPRTIATNWQEELFLKLSWILYLGPQKNNREKMGKKDFFQGFPNFHFHLPYGCHDVYHSSAPVWPTITGPRLIPTIWCIKVREIFLWFFFAFRSQSCIGWKSPFPCVAPTRVCLLHESARECKESFNHSFQNKSLPFPLGVYFLL